MYYLESDLQIRNFYFFKSSENFAEKQSTKSFLANENNVSHSEDILLLRSQ